MCLYGSISPLGQDLCEPDIPRRIFLYGNKESDFIACVTHLNRRVSQVSFNHYWCRGNRVSTMKSLSNYNV